MGAAATAKPTPTSRACAPSSPEPATCCATRGCRTAGVKVGGTGKSFAVDGKGTLNGRPTLLQRRLALRRPVRSAEAVDEGRRPCCTAVRAGPRRLRHRPAVGQTRGFFHGQPGAWTEVGGPGKDFSVDAEGRLDGLSPDGSGVWRDDGPRPLGPLEVVARGRRGRQHPPVGWREVLATSPADEGPVDLRAVRVRTRRWWASWSPGPSGVGGAGASRSSVLGRRRLVQSTEPSRGQTRPRVYRMRRVHGH